MLPTTLLFYQCGAKKKKKFYLQQIFFYIPCYFRVFAPRRSVETYLGGPRGLDPRAVNFGRHLIYDIWQMEYLGLLSETIVPGTTFFKTTHFI